MIQPFRRQYGAMAVHAGLILSEQAGRTSAANERQNKRLHLQALGAVKESGKL